MYDNRLGKPARRVAAFLRIAISILALLCAGAIAQAQNQKTAKGPEESATPTPTVSADDLVATHDQLIGLVKMTPKLALMVIHDPSLLGENSYIERNNPQLGEFLREHPAVAQNPEFYLFANLSGAVTGKRIRVLSLQHDVGWTDGGGPPSPFMIQLLPVMALCFILCAVLWLIKRLLENMRWSRTVKVQTELHNKLMDRFSSNEQLLSFMNTDAGQRLLQSMQIPMNAESPINGSSPLSRVFTSLQFGVVITLVGFGLMLGRNSVPEGGAPLMVLGTVGLMLGIGFIICAGLSFVLARHLGLLPKKAATTSEGSSMPDAKSSF